MNIVTKLAAALLVAAACFGAGYFSRTPETITETVTQTQIQEVEKLVVKTVTEKVSTPDGTTKETTTTATTQAKKTATAATAAESVPSVQAGVRVRDWSVGVKITPRLDPDAYQPTAAEIGYRAVGNIWITGSYDWLRREAQLGVEVQF